MQGPYIYPGWLLNDYKREIAERYVERLPSDERDPMRAKLEQATTTDQLTAFLEGPGRSVWELFLRDVAGSAHVRDLSPLNTDENAVLERTVQDAYKRWDHESKPEQGKEKKSLSYARSLLSSNYTARIAIALLLLFCGFFLIYRTYNRIPELSREFQEARNKVFKDSLQDDLTAVQKKLDNGSFEQTRQRITELSFSYSNLQQALEAIRRPIDEVSKLQSDGSLIASEVESAQDEFESLIQSVREKLEPIDSTLFGSTKSDDPGGEAVTTQTVSIAKEIDGLNAAIAKSPSSEGLSDQIKQIDTVFNQWDRDLIPKLEKMAKVWNKGGVLDRAGQKAVNEVEDAFLELVQAGLGQGVTSSIQDIEDYIKKNQISIDPKTSAVLEQLGLNFDSLAQSLNEVDKKAASLRDKQSELIQKASDLDSPAITNMAKNINEAVLSISATSDTVLRAKEAFQASSEALTDLRKATQNIEQIADTQSRLAAQGSAPAVLLLFAIGGMFVTFGLTSLLRWVKDLDHRRLGEQWRIEAELMTNIAVALISRGIEPTRVLDRLQNIPRTTDPKNEGAIKTPVSETMRELLKVWQSKGGG